MLGPKYPLCHFNNYHVLMMTSLHQLTLFNLHYGIVYNISTRFITDPIHFPFDVSQKHIRGPRCSQFFTWGYRREITSSLKVSWILSNTIFDDMPHHFDILHIYCLLSKRWNKLFVSKATGSVVNLMSLNT